ncbi:hypothetical protein D3C86_1653550 [compost metagenome]
MYFSPDETRALLKRLAHFFLGGEVLMECISNWAVAQSERYFKERDLSAKWRGGLAHGRDVEAWDPRLRFLHEWHYYDRHPLRLGRFVFARWIPQLKDFFKIVHLRLAAASSSE